MKEGRGEMFQINSSSLGLDCPKQVEKTNKEFLKPNLPHKVLNSYLSSPAY